MSSVLAQTGARDQAYLIDNGSTDGSDEFVRQRFGGVKVIRFEHNLGFAEAYNRAVTSISEELVVFLNNDVEVDENWLAELKSGFNRSTDRLAACGSKILLYDDRELINHAGGKLLPIGGGVDLDLMQRDEEGKRRQGFVGCVSGASMAVPRSFFLSLGGFDSDFFAYFEDVDFCWRAWLAGYRVLFVPSSRVFHKLGATMGSFLSPERLFLGERNRLQSALKNLELRDLPVALLASCVYTLSRFVAFLRLRKITAALAILRGDWWIICHLPKILTKRRCVQQSRRVHDAFLMNHGLMASLAEGFREFVRLAPLRSR